MALTGTAKGIIQALFTRDDLDLTTPQENLDLNKGWSIADGTGEDQADILFHDQITIASGGTNDLDLSGSLLDAFRSTVAAVKIKAMLIQIVSGDGILIIGAAGVNSFINWVGAASDTVKIPGPESGGGTSGEDHLFLLVAPGAGYAVTAGTGDLLRLADDGSGVASMIVNVALIGTSA